MSLKDKKKYIQKYSKIWETDPALKDWLAPDATNDSMAYCKYCHAVLKAHKKDLISHSKTEKHKKATTADKSAKSCTPITQIFKPVLSEARKVAEIKIAAFIAEHCSFLTVNHLIELLPQLDSTSDALKSLKLHRTKCAMVIKNVLGPSMMQDLISEIGDSPYSLIIDESTDLSTQKVLCIMVRFFSHNEKKIVTTFYRLIQLFHCDAKSIYNSIVNQLKVDGLKFENIVGIGVDGANVMVGKHNSVAALFKAELPDIIIIKCVCHSLHLCAEKAAEQLPRQLEFLVREAHNWFSYSPKRVETYRRLYETINANNDPKKITKLSGTRWLARFQAIETILEQWEELKLLFSLARVEDKCFMAEQLHEIMKRLPYKAFLIFLKNELKSITNLNCLFQSDNIDPTKLFEDLFLLYKSLVKRIVVPAQLEKVGDGDLVEFEFKNYIMHTSSIYFGYDFQKIAEELDANDLVDVKERCRNFLIFLAEQIQKRLPDNIAILRISKDLHPMYATSQIKPEIKHILEFIRRTHIYGIHNDIESEWHQLSNKKWSNVSTVADFYYEVFCDRDAADNRRFENIGRFGLAILTVPISNASVERAFSIYNVIKNKLRNRLSLEMLQSVMMVRFTLQRNGSCTNFKPTHKMLSMMNVQMYDSKTEAESDDDEMVIGIINSIEGY